ncbi:MAG: bacillithiol biosynthesis cysteine-adding enzyme BshC [Ignavibacteriales bacterium]|nr:bacillithiol biosynthesis cysteine-adding enzyme BshC [Ignavibacteriales bacterium]
MKTISFSQLSQRTESFTPLFLDYLNNFSAVEKYYNGDYRSPDAFRKNLETLRFPQETRNVLANVLLEQAQQYHAKSKAFENIELLKKENTFAVVTGQQVGIFLGPLYTLYKTLTTIKLAEKLSTEFPEYNFVPVFWMEGEDHDFAEANSLTMLDTEFQPKKFTYNIGGIPHEENLGAVGEVIFDFFFNDFKTSVFGLLSKTEFSENVLHVYSQCYRDGVSFNMAFAQLMNELLGESGLIFLYPNDWRLKKITSTLFKKELEEFPRSSQSIIERSAELEENYHAQIKPRALNLFLFHNGKRHAIEPTEGKFFLKGTHTFFSKEELQTMLETTPESFSPNVVLRPLCQDTLLPTISYVGGPSEIAYFAQLQPLYEYFGVAMPIIYPRASITLIEPRVVKFAEKYRWEYAELLNDRTALTKQFSNKLSEVSLEEIFINKEKQILAELETLLPSLQNTDATLSGAYETAKNKILYQLSSLKERAMAAQQKKQSTSIQQLEKAANSVFPNEHLQERTLNLLYFLNKYGLGMVEKIRKEISMDTFEHQLVEINL